MPNLSYIYSFNYATHHTELCKLESRQVFDEDTQGKLLLSNKKIDPSISAFIKSRFEIILTSENYSELLKQIEKENIKIEGFKAEYLILEGDNKGYKDRLEKMRDVGFRIEGQPDYQTPSIIYAIANYQKTWYFGILEKPNNDWLKHKTKPCSFSNSIEMYIGKTLVSIASQGDKMKKLLDACCGVGTIMLEACFSGFNVEGCDINLKTCKNARQNLTYYKYTANVHCSDVKDLNTNYDAAIIDLPYNLFSYSDDDITTNIIESTAKLTSRIVIVSISDIEAVLKKSGLIIHDCCTVEKRGRSTFARKIWVCESRE